MKYFIVQEECEYTIYKVSDDIVDGFKIKTGKAVAVEAKDIQEALGKFAVLEKRDDLPFNPVLKKFKEEVRVNGVEEGRV